MAKGPPCGVERAPARWLDEVPGPPLIIGHFDADGLSAVTILARSKPGAKVRLVGKGETPWTDAVRAELEQRRPPAIIATDLRVREGEVLPGTPPA